MRTYRSIGISRRVRRYASVSAIVANVREGRRNASRTCSRTFHTPTGMRLPKNHGRGLSAIPVERLPDREPRGVIAAADARIRRAALEPLVVAKHDDLPAQRIPQGVRVPRLDQFVPPRARDHHDEEAVIEADCLVHADLVEERERFHALAEFFPDGVVDGGYRPSRRPELAVRPE